MHETNISTVFNKKTLLLLLVCSIIFYGFSLPFSLTGTPYFSPGNDFSNHANLMYRFAESFKAGQIIPRMLVEPSAFSDGTVPTFAIPTFQYYGFFEGLFALPFNLLGLPDAISAVLSTILIRFLSLVILYETCVLFGASFYTSFLSSFSFFISPYLLTVFYGRGALAEAFAQSLLTLIPYGYALAYRGRIRQSILAFAIAFFSLALCHNIFFLYGFVFLLLLVLFSFQFKIILSAATGTLLGILLSAWQWLPSQQTISDIVIFGPLNLWKIGAGVECFESSLSGAFGIPKPYLPEGYTQPFPIYFTIGWWTFPFIFLAFISIFQKKKIRLAIPFFICSVIFCLLTFPPYDLYIFRHYVPQIFTVVQTSSRLLGFVSLLGALCFAIAMPKLNKRLFQFMMVLMIASQLPVFACYIQLVAKQNWGNELTRGAPINYYYSVPTGNKLKKSDGTLDKVKNAFYLPPNKYSRFSVRFNGYVLPPDEHIHIAIASLAEKPDFVYGKYKINSMLSQPVDLHSGFSQLIEARASSSSGWYKIILSPTHYIYPVGSIFLSQIDLIPGEISSWIFENAMKHKKKYFGYAYQFQVNQQEKNRFKADNDGFYTLALPMAYSKLFTVTQNHHPLTFFPDFNHRMLVRTKDIRHHINVAYRLNDQAIILTMLGVIGFIVILRNKKKTIPR